MSFETPAHQEMARDIYAEARDGNLTEEEQQELLQRYEVECQNIQNETCTSLDDLRQMMDIFQEALELSPDEVRMLQRVSGAGIDGTFGPQSFECFIALRESTGFQGGPQIFAQIYNNFQDLSVRQRYNFQSENGRDGVFGPNTFRYIIENNLLEQLGVNSETIVDVGLGSPDVVAEEREVITSPVNELGEIDTPYQETSLGREEIITTQGREVITFVRETTIGQHRLEEMISSGIIDRETAQLIEGIMQQEHDRFFPVLLQDGSIIFMTNPTYAPDTEGYQNDGDVSGNGVSYREAQNYAARHGYLLPNQVYTDAAREQAQVRGALHSHWPNPGDVDIQRGFTSTHTAMLGEIISQGGEERFVGGFTKIWAFNEGRDPGLNGWYGTSTGPNSRSVEDGATVQGYSTWHAGDPSYADYSQAAQFVHPIRIDPMGNVVDGTEQTGTAEIHTSSGEVGYNNGLGMTDVEFEAARREVLENGENPSYQEFREIMRPLSETQKRALQDLVGAEVDGHPGPDTYTHFMHSTVREAGFTLQEAVNLRKVLSENAREELQTIRESYGFDENWPQIERQEGQRESFILGPGVYIDYDIDYGMLTIFDPESGDTITEDVAVGTFDTIYEAFEGTNPDIIYTTLERLSTDTQRKNEYIQTLRNYIAENQAYEIARMLFTRTEERNGEQVYIIDFRGNSDLIREMVAVDIFGDVPFLRNTGDEYLQFFEPGREFQTLDRNSRLAIVDGVELFIPNPEEMEYLVRQEEIRTAVEDNILTTLQEGNGAIIRDYFSLPTISSDEKEQTLWSLRDVVFSERLFENMRSMFCDETERGYVFQPENDFLADHLVAFDIFGDYTELESRGQVYTSTHSRDYMHNRNRLSITQGIEITPIPGSERSQQEYENLNSPLERNRAFVREYVPESWQRQFLEFVSRLPDNEVLTPNDPITLADSSRRQAMYLVNGEYRTFPVIFGSGGFSDGYIASGDSRTPRGIAHVFSSVRIAATPYGDASNRGSTTVLGASLQNGPLGSEGGGKWFHGVADHRIPNGATWGCVGMNVHISRAIARDIQRNGNRGFGYVA